MSSLPPRRVLDATLARRAALRAALCAAILAGATLAFAFVAVPGVAREWGFRHAAIGVCVGLLAAPLAWVERRWEPASAGRQGALLLLIGLPFVALAALAADPFAPFASYAKHLFVSGSFERALGSGLSSLRHELIPWTLAVPWMAPVRAAAVHTPRAVARLDAPRPDHGRDDWSSRRVPRGAGPAPDLAGSSPPRAPGDVRRGGRPRARADR